MDTKEFQRKDTKDQLISRCKVGDRQALHLLYEQYKPKLLQVCKQYTKEENESEDLLHDAFVVIFTTLHQLRNNDKLESWMISIVKNVGYHYREHLRKEQTAIKQMAIEGILTEETSQMPDYDQLQTLVAQLPEGYQKVFRLSVFEGLSHQEISRLLGIAPHSSSSQLYHAKRMLKLLIKQSWVLILLLIAVPMIVLKMHQTGNIKEDAEMRLQTQKKQIPNSSQQKPQTEPIDVSANIQPINAVVRHAKSETLIVNSKPQTNIISPSDSIPYYITKEETDTVTKVSHIAENEKIEQDSLNNRYIPSSPFEMPHLSEYSNDKKVSWDIKLAYSGQIGQRDDYIAMTGIQTTSFASASNLFIPENTSYSNWVDYTWYLTNSLPTEMMSPETRSLIEIAAQNSLVNGGKMEARHEHQLPFSIQLMLSRPILSKLSIESGLSYTLLKSTTITGSPMANIQEQQKIHYLGIPLRIGYRWYSNAGLDLYSSAGAMMEMPIYSSFFVKHFYKGGTTYKNTLSYSVPFQFSTMIGMGLQYDFTPHLGIYIEPSLQYFFDNGSDLETYRTEHPLQLVLPLGIRYKW
ncbi:MAG: sigma-70 family RNA polymerase sigma factor [Prevotella sp.]|nr:sigma-70 family RNA polymerase sigma factor [Prevotella sp.]